MKFTKKTTDTEGNVVGDFDSFDAGTLYDHLKASGFKGHVNTNSNEVDVVPHPEDDAQAVETAVREHFETWPAQALNRAINAANRAIDDAAGAARSRYITISPGQEATYIAKEVDCRDYVADGYPASVGANEYLWVKAEADALGVTKRVAADTIIAQADQWVHVGSTIERIRRAGKLSVGVKLSVADVETEATNTIATLGSI